MSDRAVVLAGGRGTRLRPYTTVLPKPLMPVGDFPILEVILRQLAHFGFRRITLAVNHQADLIKTYCGDGGKWGVAIDYSLETAPLSTVGPLTLIPDLPENFILMNGDVLTDLDLRHLYDRHVQEGRLFTIAASQRDQAIDYGVLRVDADHRLTGFEEKPTHRFLVSMGIYVLNRAALGAVPRGARYGFDDLMLDFLAHDKGVTVQPYGGYWLDIGRVDDYMRAIDEFDGMRQALLHDGG